MDNKKTLTKEAVKLALDLLIVTNNQATTLEIKLHLQNLEYFAKQENVHDFMEEIFAENPGKYNRNINPGGGPAYNIYTAVTDWEATVAAKNTPVAPAQPAEVSHFNTSFSGSVIDAAIDAQNKKTGSIIDAAIDAQNKKTPMHVFHDRIRDSKIVPGVGIVAEYIPRTGELKTINDLNGGDPATESENTEQPIKINNTVAGKIASLIISKLGVEKEEVLPSASFINDLGCDSLDAIELVMEMEHEFDISIDDNVVENIKTVAECITMIEEILNASPAKVNTDLRAPIKIFYTPEQFESHKSDADYDPKNWVCHQRHNDQTEIHVYSYKVTRDQARSRFASLNHIKSGEVRCSMAVNLTLAEA